MSYKILIADDEPSIRELVRMALEEAERWIRECGFKEIRVDARTTAAGFYRKLGYEAVDGGLITSGPFECIRMRKQL